MTKKIKNITKKNAFGLSSSFVIYNYGWYINV